MPKLITGQSYSAASYLNKSDKQIETITNFFLLKKKLLLTNQRRR